MCRVCKSETKENLLDALEQTLEVLSPEEVQALVDAQAKARGKPLAYVGAHKSNRLEQPSTK